ncbi:hypothetical protein [Bradyrhizobium liaoningense]
MKKLWESCRVLGTVVGSDLQPTARIASSSAIVCDNGIFEVGDRTVTRSRKMMSLSLAFIAVMGTLVYGALLLFPITMLALDHSTLTGLYEESIGYRYFYNLRTLYETSYLFLPQGELVNLIFKGIHLVLSVGGYPAGQLFPRIDLFSYLSVAFLQCLNLLCFWWAAATLALPSSRLLAALFLGGLNYVPGTSAIYTIIQPDYHVLMVAFSLLAMGSILRTQELFDWTPRKIAVFALFVGAALSVKMTLSILPAIVLLHTAIMSRRIHIGFASAGLAALIGVAIWFGVILLDGNGHLSFVVQHFRDLLAFLQSSPGVTQSGLPWADWIFSRISNSSLAVSIIYSGPIIAGLVLLVARRRWEFAASFSFFLGAAAYGFFLFRRDYPATLVECMFPLAALLVVVSQFRLVSGFAAFKWPLIPVLLWIIVWSYPRGVGSIIGSAAANTKEQMKLREVESQLTGKILWLVESNNDRPLTVDSAIMKGGFARSSQWLDPPSEIMSSMFPNRDFRFYVDSNWATRLDDYGAIMFVYHGDLAQHVASLGLTYAIPLSTWRCRPAALVSAAPIAVCEAPPS